MPHLERPSGKLAPLLITALLLALSAGPAAAQAGAAASKPSDKVTGVWTGTTVAGCNVQSSFDRCNAQQQVTLTVVEGADSRLTGFYKCAYGTQNCYHMNETGKIMTASANGEIITIRVQMPDGTSCIFSGRTDGERVNGGYNCYSGGSLLESGAWRAVRRQ